MGTDIVLISGAAGAIGAATVQVCLRAGFRVVGLDRSEDVLHPQDGYWGCRVDLEDDGGLQRALAVLADKGALRHVIGIAGGALPEEPLAQDAATMDVELFRRSLNLNLVTQFGLLRAALPWLRRTLDGDRSVTFTSSFNALTGCGMPAYSAAKAGIIGMMHALAPALGAEGIRVNVVAPGTIRTPRTERIWAHDTDHWERLEQSTATGRLGTPADVANAFLAIATIMTHVTGQTLVVDGGQMVKRR